ncbi:MAG: RNA 2',3'-cyclic phosphodiesterase [Ilumatobacteraceae bacterium]
MTKPDASSGTFRLFVAAWPPANVVADLAGLPRTEDPGVRWTPPENWHVTLRFLGPAAVDDVRRRLEAVELPFATARLGPRVRRLGRDGIVVPVAGVDALAATVIAATRDIGRPPDDRPFHGHLTLARLRRSNVRCALVGCSYDASFPIDEVVLARSTLTPSGARYDAVARWPTRLS